jgi:hypothetical protein
MSGKKTAIIGAAAVVGLVVGWAMAMYVNSGPPLRNAEETYTRYRNALSIKDTLARTEILLKLTKQLTPETLPGAARAYEEDLWPLANSDIRILMAYWAKNSPREMVATTRGWNNSRVQQIAGTEALSEIAASEGYAAAREFYDSLPLHLRRGGLVTLVLAYADHGDLTDMAAFVTSFKDHDERDLVGEIAVERMLDNYGPIFVEEWVETLAPGRGNTSDIKVVAFRAAQRAHLDNGYRREFEQWLEKVGDESWAKGGWRSIAVHWVKTDPISAIEWARALPDDVDRLTVVQEAVRGWAVRDSEATLAWILEQQPNKELDRGTGRLVVHYAVRNPNLSLDLLERIITAETFRNAYRTASNQWERLPDRKSEELISRAKELARARFTDQSDETSARQKADAQEG